VTAAAELVQALRARGVTLEPEGDRLRIRPASALSAEELEALRQVKPEVLRLLAAQPTPTPAHHLRLTIRRWFTLAVAEVDGQRPNPRELEALQQEILRRTDETGPAYAEALIREEGRRFRWETARCGWCGNLGHDGGCER
jgi:hypothetical protein